MEQEKNTIPVEDEVITPETENTNTTVAEAAMPEKRNFLQTIWHGIHDVFFINFLCKKLKFEKWKGWVYLLPCMILILVFTVWPIINTVRMAFLDGYNSLDAIGGATFEVGIKNFQHVVKAPSFLRSLKNTMLLCILTVPLSTLLALLIAVCLNAIKPLQRFFQTVFFLPYVTNSIAIGMVFAAMFQMIGSHFGTDMERIESSGIMNTIFGWFGAEPINWMNDARSSYASNITVMVIYIVWNALPFKILILLGGLQSVNKQYYEAAKIDSTPRWRVFLKITVPLLSPMLAYVIITGFIGGFKEYSSIVGVFGESMGPTGDPGRLDTMVGYIYEMTAGNKVGRYGVASAAALILFAIIFVVTMINLYVSKKKTHY